MPCHLLIPDLFLPREIKDFISTAEVPSLELLLSRSTEAAPSNETMEDWLFNRFGVSTQQPWPVASLTVEYDTGKAGDHFWLRADPVHLRLERNQLILADNTFFSISSDEAEKLCDSLNRHLKTDNLSIIPLHPNRWYIKQETDIDLMAHSLPSMIGKNIDHYLPEGKDKMRWQRIFNEIQMLLHEHPVNLEREKRGDPVINSIWFWGGGHYPKTIGKPFSHIYSNDPLSLSLAKAGKSGFSPLPMNATDCLDHTNSDSFLIVLDGLRAPAKYGDIENWYLRLQELEQNWFKILHKFLSERRLKNLVLHAGFNAGYRQFEVTCGDLRKFWRRKRALNNWLS